MGEIVEKARGVHLACSFSQTGRPYGASSLRNAVFSAPIYTLGIIQFLSRSATLRKVELCSFHINKAMATDISIGN